MSLTLAYIIKTRMKDKHISPIYRDCVWKALVENWDIEDVYLLRSLLLLWGYDGMHIPPEVKEVDTKIKRSYLLQVNS